MEHIAPLLFLLLRLSCTASSHARSYEPHRYDTAYACEGKVLKIECREGELINLIRANYGRFSITICNDHGNTEWSVNCMSPKSLRVLHSKCFLQPNCSIPASTNMFGDPCPGTLKYLEAHYRCEPATTTTTTSRPSPPWLITSQPSVWSTAKLPTLRPPHRGFNEVSGSTTPTSTSRLPPPASEESPLPSPPLPERDRDQSQPPSSSLKPSVPPSTITHPPSGQVSSEIAATVFSTTPAWRPLEGDIQKLCKPTSVRNLNWNWTKAGAVQHQPCPGGANGFASWRCIDVPNGEALWHTDSPDLSECRSVWLTSLDSRIDEGDSIINIANDLAQVTNSNSLYGGDMMATNSIVKKMTDRMAKNIQTFPDPSQRETIVTELLQYVVKTTSNLIDDAQMASWRDLSHAEQMRVATALLVGLEENAFLLADTVIREKTLVHSVKNIVLSVRVIRVQNLDSESFPDAGERDVVADTVEVPRDAMMDNSEGGLVRIVFIAFQRLHHILLPVEEDDSQSRRNTTRVVNSNVISASLGKGRHIQLKQWVRITLRHLRVENVTNPTCVFWDYTTSGWSDEDCVVDSTNRTHTVCKCTHLTNFAVLMDVHSTYLEPEHQIALQIITYIGCIISIVCLFLAVITFHFFRGLKSDRNTIHKNLCMCLLVAEVVFLVGIGQTDKPIVCGVVAGLLHFVFLCAFAWMFLEGFQLYVMLIEVFEAEKSRMRWYYCFAYGAPLLIVCVSCVVDPLSYGTERYCWLRADNFFIFSFVGPVIAVILANLVFLSMAIHMMCRHSTASVSMKSKEHSRLASARAWLRGAIVLVILLGLTWTFGLLYLNEESVIMAYVFTILNSLQGLFIFLFHCIQNEKVRKEYRKWSSWLPKCFKCRSYDGTSSREGKEVRTSGTTGSSNTHYGTREIQPDVPNGNNKTYFKSSGREERERGESTSVLEAPYPIAGVGSSRYGGQHHYDSGGAHAQYDVAGRDVTLANLHGISVAMVPSYVERSATMGDVRRQAYRHGSDRVLVCELERQNGARAATLHVAKRRRDRYPSDPRRGEGVEDPVYEEIRQAASDMSDEELRRGVASRQSLRSYGDHSPLIPSPHGLAQAHGLGHGHVPHMGPLSPHTLQHPPDTSFVYQPRSHHDR